MLKDSILTALFRPHGHSQSVVEIQVDLVLDPTSLSGGVEDEVGADVGVLAARLGAGADVGDGPVVLIGARHVHVANETC